MGIRAETRGDREAVYDVNRRAFGRDVEPQLVEAIRDSPEALPELALVAEEEGVVVGHIVLSRVQVGGEDAVVLAPVAVVPERQSEGIGGELVRAAIDLARAQGERLVVLVGHPWYYPRFGFVPASTLGIEHPTPIADDVFMALPLADDHPRGRLEYPPAFAAVT